MRQAFGLAGGGEFVTQTLAGAVQQVERPAPVVDLVGRERVRRLVAVAFLGRHLVERQRPRAAATFLGAGAVPFVGEETFERREQKPSEPAPFPIRNAHIVFLEQFPEKVLGEILRRMHIEPLPPHVRVKRIPIDAT